MKLAEEKLMMCPFCEWPMVDCKATYYCQLCGLIVAKKKQPTLATRIIEVTAEIEKLFAPLGELPGKPHDGLPMEIMFPTNPLIP